MPLAFLCSCFDRLVILDMSKSGRHYLLFKLLEGMLSFRFKAELLVDRGLVAILVLESIHICTARRCFPWFMTLSRHGTILKHVWRFVAR